MFSNQPTFLLILNFFILLFFVNASILLDETAKTPPSYEEFKALVPSDIYDKLVKIYSNKTLLVVDKLKELDDIFMSLPESTLSLLPTPKAFRKLSNGVQTKIRHIYYSKHLGFEEKLKEMENIMHKLPQDQLKLIPLQPELPGLLEFDVPVLLQFNGQIETYLLRNYLSTEEFDLLTQIINKKNSLEVSRARLIGGLLRDAYEKHPEHFPIPLGDDDPQVPEEIRRLGIHLMFSKQPFEKIDLFTRALNQMKLTKSNSSRFSRIKNEKQSDCQNQQPNIEVKQLEHLGHFLNHFYHNAFD